MLYLRPPAAAGSFYDLEPDRLKKQIQSAFSRASADRKLKAMRFKAAVVPHAGYMYSGWVAAKVYSMFDVKKPLNFIILGTNHYMFGSKYAIMKSGLWKTPLGVVAVDESMAGKLLEKCELLENDVMPHQNEHSIEVQLPFLQHLFGSGFKFVPITIACDIADDIALESYWVIGKAIADVVKADKESWLVLASSDFSHYVPQNLAEETDGYVIKAILKLDEKEFVERVAERSASVCGFGAIAVAIAAAKVLGSKKGKLLKYATSADTTGDVSAVVGYAAIIL